LGVKFYFGYSFLDLYRYDQEILTRCEPNIPGLTCSLLIGSDGVASTVAKRFDFRRTTFTGNLCIGVTFNFQNNHTKQEVSLREFALASLYNQSFFKDIQERFNITLENLVYYQGETHYFVMTIKKNSLIDRGVFKEIKSEISELLDSNNILEDELLSIARDTASFCGLPSTCDIVKNHMNKPDVQLFDFSERIQSEEAVKSLSIPQESTMDQEPTPIDSIKSSEVMVTLVGDALIEPLWVQDVIEQFYQHYL